MTAQKKGEVAANNLPSLHTTTTGVHMTNLQEQRSGSIPASPHQRLVAGVDTLITTAGGSQGPSDWLVDQQVVWSEYQRQYDYSAPEYLEVEVGQHWFQLYPTGTCPYKFRLYNPQVGYIKVWGTNTWCKGSKGKQNVMLDLRSSFIRTFDINTLKVWIRNFYSLFFADMEGVEIQVSRGDIFTDIMCDNMLTTEEAFNSISRCKTTDKIYSTSVSFTEEELELLRPVHPVCNKVDQKLIPLPLLDKLNTLVLNQNSYGCDRVIGNTNRLETCYWGNHKGGEVWGKVYDKTLKVKKDNDTDLEALWLLNGWNKDRVVVRTEFSMRRKFLKELNSKQFVTLEGFLDNLNVIWEYFTTKWLRLVECKKKNNLQTSTITSFWECVTSSFLLPEHKVVRERKFAGKVDQLFRQGVGCLTTMIGYGMNGDSDITYIKGVIGAVDKVINEAYEDNSILYRRRTLGIATCS
jgi:hypothetical protein